MPNIVSSSVSSAGITLQASDGASVTVPPSWVLSQHNSLAGTDLQHVTVQRRIAEHIQSSLGEENVLADQIAVDYDEATGVPTELTIYSG